MNKKFLIVIIVILAVILIAGVIFCFYMPELLQKAGDNATDVPALETEQVYDNPEKTGEDGTISEKIDDESEPTDVDLIETIPIPSQESQEKPTEAPANSNPTQNTGTSEEDSREEIIDIPLGENELPWD